MDKLAQIVVLGNHLQCGITHIFRVRSSETDTHIRHGKGNFFEQSREIHHSVFILEFIGIHILTKQSNLLITTTFKVLHLSDNTIHFTATLTAASIWHNTIRAEIIAASHDAYKAGNRLADTRRHNILIRLCSREFHIDSLSPRLNGRDQIRQIEIRVGTRYKVHPEIIYQLLLHTLRHATDNTHNEMLVFLAQRSEILEPSDNLLLGIITDRTGIYNNGICLGNLIPKHIPYRLHHRSNNLTISNIHLTSISLNK